MSGKTKERQAIEPSVEDVAVEETGLDQEDYDMSETVGEEGEKLEVVDPSTELKSLDEWAKESGCSSTMKRILALLTKKGERKTQDEWNQLRLEIGTKRI